MSVRSNADLKEVIMNLQGSNRKVLLRFSASEMHLSLPGATVRYKAVVLLLLINCLKYFPLFVGVLCLSFLLCISLCPF